MTKLEEQFSEVFGIKCRRCKEVPVKDENDLCPECEQEQADHLLEIYKENQINQAMAEVYKI